jgi:hypothetical protein
MTVADYGISAPSPPLELNKGMLVINLQFEGMKRSIL